MTTNLPERTASPLELARETTRQIPCACGARPGFSCDGNGGMHLSRYADARRGGHITEAQMGAVIEAAEVITSDRIVASGAAAIADPMAVLRADGGGWYEEEEPCWATRLGQREVHDLRMCSHYPDGAR